MLDIIIHWKSANESHNEVSLHTAIKGLKNSSNIGDTGDNVKKVILSDVGG